MTSKKKNEDAPVLGPGAVGAPDSAESEAVDVTSLGVVPGITEPEVLPGSGPAPEGEEGSK